MDEPIEHGSNEAANIDRVEGIVAQTRADAAAGHVTDIEDALRQRFADAGIAVSDEQLQTLAAEVR